MNKLKPGRSFLPERTVFVRSFLPERTSAEGGHMRRPTGTIRRLWMTICNQVAASREVLPDRQDLLCLLTFLTFFTFLSLASAQDPTKPNEQFIPADQLDTVFDRDRRGVMMKREEFQALLQKAGVGVDAGVVAATDVARFLAAAKTRHWAREAGVRTLA